MTITAQALFDWARAYAKRHEDVGDGTQYPTMREATRRFRCTLDDIEDIIGDDIKGDHYLGIAVGGRVGSGYFVYETRGEQQIEAY